MADIIQIETEAIDELNRPNTSRRQLLARAGIIGAAALGSGMLGLGKRNRAEAVMTAKFGGPKGMKYTLVDADILNFALNLEYLEAQFYQVAAFGTPLSADLLTGTGTQGTVTGGSQVNFSSDIIAQYAQEIATDELNHVKLLRDVLGKKAVAQPAIDIGPAFAAAATAANLAGTFTPYDSDADFLLGAFVFEDVGVTAYHGAAPYISKSAYLSAAAGILAVEAYHAAEVRTLLIGMSQTTPALVTAANAISNLRGAASAAADATALNGDQGITVPNAAGTASVVNIVPADANSVAFARTFPEVLNIVYLGGLASSKGGFFPAGTNGKIS